MDSFASFLTAVIQIALGIFGFADVSPTPTAQPPLPRQENIHQVTHQQAPSEMNIATSSASGDSISRQTAHSSQGITPKDWQLHHVVLSTGQSFTLSIPPDYLYQTDAPDATLKISAPDGLNVMSFDFSPAFMCSPVDTIPLFGTTTVDSVDFSMYRYPDPSGKAQQVLSAIIADTCVIITESTNASTIGENNVQGTLDSIVKSIQFNKDTFKTEE